MDPTGNTYDAATNTMTIGGVDACLASPESNPTTHTHTTHVVIENTEDVIGWQTRLNYNGDEMRPANIDFDPFLDTTTGQEVSFVNLPKDAETNSHREIVSATNIPPAAPGPQSALIGAVYNRAQSESVSPDTPAKNPPDDSSYSAPNGGVLATVDLEVSPDRSGPTLFMQLDDGNPYPPGSSLTVFTDVVATTIDLSERQLSSGFHAEGAETCSAVPMPTNGPTGPMVADIAMTEFAIDAPQSVEAGQVSNVTVAWAIQNLGPDEVEVGYQVWIWSAPLCLPPTQFVGSEVLPALGELRREIVVPFTCSESIDGTRPVTFHAIGHAFADSTFSPKDDPNPYNNGGEAQATVTVLGTDQLPTPTPEPTPTPSGPIEHPTNTPGGPGSGTPTPAAAPVLGGAPGMGIEAGAAVSVNQPQAVLAARGPPSTGKLAADDTPGLAQFLVAVIALGLPTAAGVGIHRLIARRP